MRVVYLFFLVFLYSCSNTIYIVRHAEKEKIDPATDKMTAANPPLTMEGKVRAIALRNRLRSKNIHYIYSTNTTRTISTAQPLNELRGNTSITIYSSRKDSLDYFIAQLKKIKKGNVLVVGHSNTIDDIANKLSGKVVVAGDLNESEYDNLFELKRQGSKYRFRNKKYGVRTN